MREENNTSLDDDYPDNYQCTDMITALASTSSGVDQHFLVWRPDVYLRTATDSEDGFVFRTKHEDPVAQVTMDGSVYISTLKHVGL